jgi:hypothetical protein
MIELTAAPIDPSRDISQIAPAKLWHVLIYEE